MSKFFERVFVCCSSRETKMEASPASKMRLSKHEDYTKTIPTKSKRIEIAVNQIVAEYFTTKRKTEEIDDDPDRDFAKESDTMRRLLGPRQRAASEAIQAKLEGRYSKYKCADSYYLVDSEWCNSWKKFLRDEISYIPSAYVSDDELYERLNEGEILQHRTDFYLIANNSDWDLFMEDFQCGIALKFKPDSNNQIDPKEVEKLRKKYAEGNIQKEQTETNSNAINGRESLLIQRNQRYLQRKNKSKNQGDTAQRKDKRSLKEKTRKHNGNGASGYFDEEDTYNKSTSNPDYLIGGEQSKQRGEGASSEEENKFVTPRDQRGVRNKNRNLTPNAQYEGELKSFDKKNKNRRRDASMTPGPGEAHFNRTYTGMNHLLMDGKGRSLRKASDDSGENHKAEDSRDSHRSDSPDQFDKRYASLDLYKNVGLINPRNDCFMNASLQVLFSVPEFIRFFAQRGYNKERLSRDKYMLSSKKDTKGMVLSGYKYCDAMGNLCSEVCSGDLDRLRAGNLRNMFRRMFSKDHQHDSNEFILSLFSNLQDEQTPKSSKFISDKCNDEIDAWDKYTMNYNSIIDKLFVGMIRRSIRCGSCKKVVDRYECFNQIELECKQATLEKAYKDFLSDEVMKKKQSYKCDECKKVVKCRIMREVIKMPQYLFFLFKRFNSNRSKISKKIKYPQNIVLEDKIDGGPLEYELQGVVIHSGGLNGGHYISIAKKSSQWIKFDDASFYKIKKKQVIDKDAYILLYKRS
ncbi:unnamed protein product [Moneuplotes crassus]|uniref:Ubiquitinyl hydrolase 1 n=1 Tax=Euplotes crassus TaxID=5936 RepID=A0AAD2DCC3_EUPCR|nr:unnamed protein product [Moneuplotes crassus]